MNPASISRAQFIPQPTFSEQQRQIPAAIYYTDNTDNIDRPFVGIRLILINNEIRLLDENPRGRRDFPPAGTEPRIIGKTVYLLADNANDSIRGDRIVRSNYQPNIFNLSLATG